MRRGLLALLAGFACMVLADGALAHDARPLSIQIVEQQDHAYRVDVRIPPSVEAGNHPDISWPAGCAVRSRRVRDSGEALAESMLLACPEDLAGQPIEIRYTLYNPSLSTLFRFSPASGPTRSAVLPPEEAVWRVPAAPDWKAVARDYLLLGIKHIWEGLDHLLFVGGLLILAGTPRRIAFAVTGFTMAHSVTLSLSALGWVRLPVPPIEVGIALSILFLAREIAHPDPDSLARRYPLAVSSSFGLLHGFGFAAALGEAGLPPGEIVSALLFFNAGVEIGQLAFIACLLAVLALAAGLSHRSGVPVTQPALERAELLGGYILGIPAAIWFLERLEALWRH